MSPDDFDADALRTREHELAERIASRREEIEALHARLSELGQLLPGLRSRVDDQLKLEAAAPAPPEPKSVGVKLVLALALLPFGAVFGALSGLFAWGFIGGPALVLNPDPELVLGALPVLVGMSVLVGLAYVLVKIWQ